MDLTQDDILTPHPVSNAATTVIAAPASTGLDSRSHTPGTIGATSFVQHTDAMCASWSQTIQLINCKLNIAKTLSELDNSNGGDTAAIQLLERGLSELNTEISILNEKKKNS